MDKIEKIEAFKLRTRQLFLRVIKLFQALPKTDEARILGKQLLFDLLPQLLQITGQLAEQDQKQSFLVKYLL